MNDDNPFVRPLQSLRKGLRDLLRLRKGHAQSQTIGSGILRRATPPSTYQLPQLSAVSLFPDFGASDFDIRQYAIRNRAQEYLPAPAAGHLHPKQTLLPATSLSQFNLSKTFSQHGEVRPHRVMHEQVSDGYGSGMSRQASLVSLAPSALHRSTSSLRLRESKQDLRNSTRSPQRSLLDEQKKAREDVSSPQGSRSLRRSSQTALTGRHRCSNSSSSSHRRNQSPLTLVDHFRSFVVLDTAMSGCPVTATSSDLSYIFQIGEEFFLNNQEAKGASMDIVSGTDAAGNSVTHLVLFSPLVAPSSGRSRFMIACLVDVTGFIHDTATLPELDTISEEGSILSLAGAVATPALQSSPAWTTLNHELSVDDLLGGCCISDNNPSRTVKDPLQDDIWLDLAFSEGKNMTPNRRSNSRGGQSMHAPPTASSRSSRSSVSSVDDVLDAFVTSLQNLYSEFFLLGKSPLDDNCYEICNVSPKVYEAKEYVDGHLSRTPRHTIERLSANLTLDSPFNMSVNWGNRGEPKQLYCSPLYGQRSVTWVCFLVEPEMSLLW